MVSGSYFDNNGQLRKYGTLKAVPTTGGDYSQPGDNRKKEFLIDLTLLTASPLIINDVTWIDSGVYIESVEVVAETAAVGGTSLSVGLIGNDRSTVASNTGFVSALVTASMAQGNKNVLVGGSTSAGAYVGTVAGTPSVGYLTALAAGTFSAGKVRVRVNYRTNTTITQ